jgi:hypothetical protein
VVVGGRGGASVVVTTGGAEEEASVLVGVGGLRTQLQTEAPALMALSTAATLGRQAPRTQLAARFWMAADEVGSQRPGGVREGFRGEG